MYLIKEILFTDLGNCSALPLVSRLKAVCVALCSFFAQPVEDLLRASCLLVALPSWNLNSCNYADGIVEVAMHYIVFSFALTLPTLILVLERS